MAVSWTPEQQKVIDLRNRNILVSAAAGSGKTAVLVERILTRITDSSHPVDMDELLIVTFTRAAASEMKERIRGGIEKLLEADPENEHLQKQSTLIHNAQINTIDGFCSYVIRNYFQMIDLDPGFRTAEDGELRLLKRDVMKNVIEEAYARKDPDFLDFVECYATGKDDGKMEDEILKLYEYSMSYPWPREWLASCNHAYEITNVQQLSKTPWVRLVMEENQQELHHASFLLEKLIDQCKEEEQAEKYLEVLQDDLCQLRGLQKLRDYDQMVEALENVKWKRLPVVKSTSLSPEIKKVVQDGRKEVKDRLKKHQEDYFTMSLEEALVCIRRCEKPLGALVDLTICFMDAFAEKKREKNLLDFSDMEHFALEILVKKEGEKLTYSQAARDFSQRFEEIFIDEYQDSNLVQETILTAVSKVQEGKHNIFMVGDVKQSIYRFRLARPELFMEKYHTYSQEDSSTQRVDLHKNFRSRKEVLQAVNYIFAQIMGEDLGKVEYDKAAALYSGAQYPELTGESPVPTQLLLVEQDSPGMEQEHGVRTVREMEALAVAGKIQDIVGKDEIWDSSLEAYRKIAYGDIVILLRTTAGWAEDFSQVLESCGIPAYAASKTGYFSAQEVVTVLNYLHILDNPRQDIPLAAVLYSPIGGFTSQQLGQIRGENKEGDLYKSIISYLEQGQDKTLVKALNQFWRQYEKLRSCVSYTPIHELILKLLHETQYDLYISAMPAGEQREANIRMLVEKAMEFEKTSYRGLFNFIRYIQQLQKYNVDYGEVNLAGGDNVVQIMSIHKSKGLEFPVVFVSGLGKQFNQQDINSSLVIHPDFGIGADCILPEYRIRTGTMIKKTIRQELKKENLGEELRVLYVALTRAKERLIMTGAVSKVDKLMDDCASITRQKEQRLLYQNRVSARCYLDWILLALARHPAFHNLYEQYNQISAVTRPAYQPEPPISIQFISAYDLIQQQAGVLLERRISEEELKHWNSSKIYDPTLREQLAEKFSFCYPYENQKDIPVKVTVSELKKQHNQVETEAYDLFFEPDVAPLIPDFMKKDKEEKVGSYRGTAYHRFMECVDFTRDNSREHLEEQRDNLVKFGKMDEQMASCVDLSDIEKFIASSLGERMTTAQINGKLHREQPFVISQKASTMRKRWGEKETILVQGIIDVYFIEEEGIILVDYKTDRVKNPQELVEHYQVQLDYYATALERMTGKKVTEKIIYSFALGKEILI